MHHWISYSNAWIQRVDGAGRRMAGWAVLLIGIATLLVSLYGGGALYGLLSGVIQGHPALDRIALNLCVVGPLCIVALAGLGYERRGEQRANAGLPLALGAGGVIGFLGFALAVGLSALLGALGPGASDAAPMHRLAGLLIGAAIIAFQAYGEELFFRGWMQPVLATRWGPWIGLGATSILFALAHAFGRPLSALALINDALAGMAFGLLAFRSGGLAAPFAAHFAWNWAEQSVFGLTPNPGVDVLGSLWDLDLVGAKLLGAGPDEMNGAIQATVALVVMAGLALAWAPKAGRRLPGVQPAA